MEKIRQVMKKIFLEKAPHFWETPLILNFGPIYTIHKDVKKLVRK
jgi:hypothetical protein